MEAQHSLQISALPSRGQIRRALPMLHLGHFVFTAQEVEAGSTIRQLLGLIKSTPRNPKSGAAARKWRSFE
jgi:hypothetical protein